MPEHVELLSRDLAAGLLGLSVRRLMEISAEGQIGRVVRRDPDTKRENTYFRRADLEAYRRKSAAASLTPAPPKLTPRLLNAPQNAPPAEKLSALPRVLPYWLRYHEAVTVTGLGETRLRELVDGGKIRTEDGPHGSIVLSRADLERHAGMRPEKS